MEENAQVKVSAIIVAAGASRRMGFDKLSYRLPGGKTVLETSVAAFAAHPQVDELILVAGGNLPACQAIAAACPKPCTVVGGGATRADSVCNGLRAAKGQLVAIHDAARPFVSEQVITDALAEAEAMGPLPRRLRSRIPSRSPMTALWCRHRTAPLCLRCKRPSASAGTCTGRLWKLCRGKKSTW